MRIYFFQEDVIDKYVNFEIKAKYQGHFTIWYFDLNVWIGNNIYSDFNGREF